MPPAFTARSPIAREGGGVCTNSVLKISLVILYYHTIAEGPSKGVRMPTPSSEGGHAGVSMLLQLKFYPFMFITTAFCVSGALGFFYRSSLDGLDFRPSEEYRGMWDC